MELEERLAACARRWGLEIEGPLAGGHRSDVFGCKGDLVLKLTPTPQECRLEAAALRAWSGSGSAVHLVDVDERHDALLLRRIYPATHLPPGDATAIAVATELLPRLHACASSFPFPTMEAAYDRHERQCIRDAEWEQIDGTKRPAIGPRLLPQARVVATRLIASTQRQVLLHGDFIDKNLLFDGSGYLASDPIPRRGDPCSDIGFFAAYHPPATGLLDAAADIARVIGEPVDRAIQWASVWAVGEACETWRADSDDLQAVVASLDF